MDKINEFVKVSEKENELEFTDIWKIYDKQFEILRDYLLTLGDKYEVEQFTHISKDTLITIKKEYSKGQLFVYVDNVIQWKDIDYEEVDSTHIKILKSIKSDAIVRVVIINSNIIQNGLQTFIDSLKELLANAETLYKANTGVTTQIESEIAKADYKLNKIRDIVNGYFDENGVSMNDLYLNNRYIYNDKDKTLKIEVQEHK